MPLAEDFAELIAKAGIEEPGDEDLPVQDMQAAEDFDEQDGE